MNDIKNEAGTKPTGIKPTDIKPTDIKPTDIKPTEIKPTDIKPTDIRPTEIKPTDIKPTDIKPTDIKPASKSVSKYSKATSVVAFSVFVVVSLLTDILWIVLGWQNTLIVGLLVALASLLCFCIELKKMPITQQDIDDWNSKITRGQTMKLADFGNIFNRFSFWTHTLKVPVLKVMTCIALIGTLGMFILTSALHFAGVIGDGNGFGSSNASVAGNTYVNNEYTFTFSDSNNYTQRYEGSVMDQGTWSQTGNKVTCKSKGGATIVFTVEAGSITDTSGRVWKKK